MIGANLPHHIQSADDARAYAAAIAALRAEEERRAAPYNNSLAAFKVDADAIQAERDSATAPYPSAPTNCARCWPTGWPAIPMATCATASKPDVLVRLRWWLKELPPEYVGLREDIANAIAVIEGLRETSDRRLATIRDLQRELADLRPSKGR